MNHDWQPLPKFQDAIRCKACERVVLFRGVDPATWIDPSPECPGIRQPFNRETGPSREQTDQHKQRLAEVMLADIRKSEVCGDSDDVLEERIAGCLECPGELGCPRKPCMSCWGEWRKALAGRTCGKMPKTQQ
jgi:hypothetical protein